MSSSHTPAGPAQRSGRTLDTLLRPRVVVALVIAVLVALFIGQNRQRVSISLLTVHLEAPLWLLLTVVAALGLVVGLLLRRR